MPVSVSFSLSLPNLSISKHNSWFMIHIRTKSKDYNAKLQFMNGSKFELQILSNYRNFEPKMYHVGHFCSLFRYTEYIPSMERN